LSEEGFDEFDTLPTFLLRMEDNFYSSEKQEYIKLRKDFLENEFITDDFS
jgi:hypothetical protein